MLIIVIIIVIALGIYIRSLTTHPFTKCEKCGGRGRFYHGIFTGSFGLCPKCGGNGRQLRRGARPPGRK